MRYVSAADTGTGSPATSPQHPPANLDEQSEHTTLWPSGEQSDRALCPGTDAPTSKLAPSLRVAAGPSATGKTSSPTVGINPQAARSVVRRYLARASEAAQTLSASADIVTRGNAGFDLLDALDALWDVRGYREDDEWGDVLNILQTVLRKADFVTMPQEQCDAIVSIVKESLDSLPLDSDDVARALATLRDAGLDPWAGISGDAENGE